MKRPKPILVVDLFPEILNQLLALLTSLNAEDWNMPTICTGWSVKDVALHLLGVEIGNLSTRRDDHSSGSTLPSWEELVTFINEWNQQWVQVARRISAKLLIDLLEVTGGQVYDYFRSLDPEAMGGPISWVGPEPAPVWLDIAREYTERWHHQQHIRDAVGKPGLKQPRYFEPVLGTFAWALPHTFHGINAPEGTSVTLTITGESGGQWSVQQEEGNWRLYERVADHVDAEVLIDADIAWRLFTRGLSQDQAREEMTFIGDPSLGLKILEMRSIIA